MTTQRGTEAGGKFGIRDAGPGGESEHDADHSAEQREQTGFEQELYQDVVAGGAERLADADLAGALRSPRPA